MRKLFTILALAAVTSAPVLAQDGPVRTDQDSKVIYFQDFEKSYESWSTDPSDSIVGMSYYDTKESPKPETVGNLSIYPVVRDTTLYLYDILDTGGDEGDFDEDEYSIVKDGEDNSRKDAFDLFGADGGKQYLKYSAGYSNVSNGVQPNYRRNLDVRGIPIEEETSYRISMLLKVENRGSYVPTFRADIRRGTSRCNSSLSMGYLNDAANYMYKNSFEFETTSFEDGWDRVSFMAYYTNDSIAQRYMYAGSYNSSWGNFWSWKPDPANAPNDSLMYVVQPNHYYLRLAFSTDSVIYSLDNLSLTKSWIGGVEHYKDMLRVDFGYDTDMDQICAAEKAAVNIDAVELPGKYFTVWGLDSKDKEWYEVEIASAEYHGDGYMYMWTAPIEDGGKTYPNEFEGYDSVLVSFKNPVDDPKLCLHYDGELFPKANDIEWIKNGKILPDFTNEISTMNPHISKNVYSLKNLPPVLQSMPFENGSFGLDGSIRELTFKFSKQLAFDNVGESSTNAFLRVTKSGVKEIWTVKESNDSCTIFQRPGTCTGSLDGEYQFEILNIKGANTDRNDNIKFTLEFGDFDLNPSDEVVLQTNWSKEVTGTDRPIPTSLVVWNDKDGFIFGDGKDNSDHGNFLYLTETNTNGYDCGMFISARNKGKKTNGNVYLGLVDPIHVKPGKYSFSFISGTRIGTAKTIVSCFKYSITGKNESTIETEIKAMADDDQTAKDKILIGEFTPTQIHPESQWESGKWPENVDSYSFLFEITEESDYVFDFTIGNVKANNGPVISDITIKPVSSISAPYVSAFNKALASAKEKQTLANANVKYQGAYLDELGQIITKYEGWKNTAPSAYDKTTAAINAGITSMNLRIQTVDDFLEQYGKVNDKLAEFDSTANKNLAAVIALQNFYDDNSNFDFTAATATNELLEELMDSIDNGIDAIDARLANMDLFTAKIAQMNAQLTDSLAQTGLDEFVQLQNVYDQYKNADLVTPADEQLAAMYDAICNGYNGYVFKVQYIEAKTSRIKALFALNEQLEWDFNKQKDSIQATIDVLQDGDSQLESLLETAAKYMIVKSFSESKTLEGIDASALIPNYNLVAVAEGLADMEDKDDFSRIARSKNVTSVFPNWTVNYTSGSVYPGDKAMDWKKYAHTFVAGLYTALSTTCEISTDAIEGLPAACYQVRANFKTNNVSNSKFYITVGKNKVVDGVSVAKSVPAKTYTYDSILVNNESLTLKYKLSSSSGTGHVHFAGVGLVIQGPVAGADYSSAVTELGNKITEIVSFVDNAVDEGGKSQYYGLDGRMIQAPKAGQIVIRKTTLENGSTVVDKVLVK